MVGQPAAMGEHVAQGDLARHPWIIHLEPGIVPGDRVVPGDHAVPDQRGHDRRGDRLGDGRQLKDRVGTDRCGRALLAHPEPLEIDDLIHIHDGDRHPGNAAALQSVLRQLLQLRERSFDLLSRHNRRRRGQGRGRGQGGERGEHAGGRRGQHRPSRRFDEKRRLLHGTAPWAFSRVSPLDRTLIR